MKTTQTKLLTEIRNELRLQNRRQREKDARAKKAFESLLDAAERAGYVPRPFADALRKGL